MLFLRFKESLLQILSTKTQERRTSKAQPGKLQTITSVGRDVMECSKIRPNNASTLKLTENASLRIGQVEGNNYSWDNGFYTNASIGNINVQFLIDSGATSTLISKETFDRCGGGVAIFPLKQYDNYIRGVDGKTIQVYGTTTAKLDFGSFSSDIPIIVRDISLEGILGQDFIMSHVKTCNLERYELTTKCDRIIEFHNRNGHTMDQGICRLTTKEAQLVRREVRTWVEGFSDE